MNHPLQQVIKSIFLEWRLKWRFAPFCAQMHHATVSSYSELNKNFHHQPETISQKEAGKVLPWVHKTISNAKRMLLDVHHRIDDDFLHYLNAYVFKLNRRYFKDIFENVLRAAVSYQWDSLGETSG